MKLLAIMIVLGTAAVSFALALSPSCADSQVLCCCNTMNGQCCNWVSFCSGIVEGCVCQ